MGIHMKLNLTLLLVLLILANVYSTPSIAQDSPDPYEAQPARTDLIIPDEIWNQVLDGVNFSDRKLGFTPDEMKHMAGTDHIPRLVGDGPDVHQGLSCSVGYIKAMLAALAGDLLLLPALILIVKPTWKSGHGEDEA